MAKGRASRVWMGWIVVSVVSLFGGCSLSSSGLANPCAGPTDCPDGFVCDGTRCVVEGIRPAPEAGAEPEGDASVPPIDAGEPGFLADAGSPEDAATEGDATVDAGTELDSGPAPDPCASCDDAEQCCEDACVAVAVRLGTDGRDDASFANCAGCGAACDVDQASACARIWGTVQCSCGFGPACPMDERCTYRDLRFQCVGVDSDPENCGAIGHGCNPGEDCVSGACSCRSRDGGGAGACGAGEICCDGHCANPDTHSEHCGGCDNVCGPDSDRCVAGSCQCGPGTACAGPSLSNLGEICCAESCTAVTDENCGSCGYSCGGDERCGVGLTSGRYCCTESVTRICLGF